MIHPIMKVAVSFFAKRLRHFQRRGVRMRAGEAVGVATPGRGASRFFFGMNGKIKSIINERGFGFLTDDEGHDSFFHVSDCVTTSEFYALSEGDKVTFEEVTPMPPKGRRAYMVQRVPVPA